jgi:hypothetical protein
MDDNQKVTPKRDLKKIYFGVGIGVVVIILGCTTALATKIWDPSWNPFQPNPMLILNSSISRLSELQYLHTDIDLNVSAVDQGEKIGLEYKMSMDVDNDPDEPKSFTNLSVGILSHGIKMVFSGDAIEIGDIAYMRLRGIPYVIQLQLDASGIDIKEYANRWYKLDPAELGISVDSSVVEELEESLTSLNNKYKIVKFVKRLDSEIINNEATYHYLFRVDKDESMKYILDFFSLAKEQVGETAMEDPGIDEIYEEIEGILSIIEPIEFEVWIGKSTHVLYKARYQKRFDPALLRAGGIIVSQENENDTIDVNLEVRLSDLNIVNTIEAPQESESLIDLISPFIDQVNEMKANPEIISGTCIDNPEI